MWRLMILNKSGEFFQPLYFKIFLRLFFFLSFWNSHYTYVGRLLFHTSEWLCSFFFNFYLSYSNWMISIGLSSSLLILLPSQICYWVPLVNFSFQLLYISILELPFKKIIYIILVQFLTVIVITLSFNS